MRERAGPHYQHPGYICAVTTRSLKTGHRNGRSFPRLTDSGEGEVAEPELWGNISLLVMTHRKRTRLIFDNDLAPAGRS